jgi:hypothetical protein
LLGGRIAKYWGRERMLEKRWTNERKYWGVVEQGMERKNAAHLARCSRPAIRRLHDRQPRNKRWNDQESGDRKEDERREKGDGGKGEGRKKERK